MCRQASLTSIPSFVRSSRSFPHFTSLNSNHDGIFGLESIGVAYNGEQLVGIGALPRPEVLKSEISLTSGDDKIISGILLASTVLGSVVVLVLIYRKVKNYQHVRLCIYHLIQPLPAHHAHFGICWL
jgi:hypothetical protein